MPGYISIMSSLQGIYCTHFYEYSFFSTFKLDFINNLVDELKHSVIGNKFKIYRMALLVFRILQNPELVSEIGNHFYSDIDQFLNAMLLSDKFQPALSAMVIN